MLCSVYYSCTIYTHTRESDACLYSSPAFKRSKKYLSLLSLSSLSSRLRDVKYPLIKVFCRALLFLTSKQTDENSVYIYLSAFDDDDDDGESEEEEELLAARTMGGLQTRTQTTAPGTLFLRD